MKKKNSGYFYAATLEVIQKGFEEHGKIFEDDWALVLDNPGKWFRTRPEIVNTICKKKSLEDKILNKEKYYQPAALRPSVHRSLEALLETGEVLLVLDKYYVPNVPETRRLSVISELREIPYVRDDIFLASPKLAMIPISKIKNGEIGTIKELFRTFIGEKHCYDVRVTKHYIVLMIEGTAEEVADIGRKLENTVRFCYQSQQPKGRGLHKKKPVLKYAWVEETKESDEENRKDRKKEEANTGNSVDSATSV